ncbi:MAG: hypothetical protein V4596_08695 [Bdellovibrionota bacterium]
MEFNKLQLVLLLSFFSLNSWGAPPSDYARYELSPDKEWIYKRAKDYYIGEYGFNTEQECKGPRCLKPQTKITCSKYSYIDYGSSGKIQFCHINRIEEPSGKARKAGNNLLVATGYIELDENGKFKRYIPGLPSNRVFRKKIPIPSECADNCGPVLKPEPKADGVLSGINIVREIADRLLQKPSIRIPQGPELSAAEKKQIGDRMAAKLQYKGGFNAMCSAFIQKNGELGPLGKKFIQAMKKVGWQYFDGGPLSIDYSSVCPNYKNFSNAKKEYLQAWFGASMAQEESSCNPNESAKGANDIADGLFQMEFSAQQRKAAGRNPKFCPHTGIDSKDITFQMECTASILKDINAKQNRGLTYRSGYWDKLRGTNVWTWTRKKTGKKHTVVPEISWHIMDFPGCGATKPKSAPKTPVLAKPKPKAK